MLADSIKTVETEPLRINENYPTAIVVLKPGGIEVELQHWTGCSMTMAEKMWFHILKAVQAHRAQSLQQMRKDDQAKEVANA